MRRLMLALVAITVALSATPATAQTLSDKPWSAGLGLGFITLDSVAAFAMEIPVEYTFKVGPGELAPHFGFLLAAAKGYTGIALPLGVRYKFRLIKQPLYLGPLLDLGPTFATKGGGVGGILRFGAVLSYLVHKNVEVLFQPLGLGAVFSEAGGVFSYNLLVGAQARF